MLQKAAARAACRSVTVKRNLVVVSEKRTQLVLLNQASEEIAAQGDFIPHSARMFPDFPKERDRAEPVEPRAD